MASFREIRRIILQSFDDGDISEDEFLLLYIVNTFKNPVFPYESYGKFDLNDMDDNECLSEFRFRKTFPSFLRPYISLATLHVKKEQYAMELKGCVSQFEGLRTHVDSVI